MWKKYEFKNSSQNKKNHVIQGTIKEFEAPKEWKVHQFVKTSWIYRKKVNIEKGPQRLKKILKI